MKLIAFVFAFFVFNAWAQDAGRVKLVLPQDGEWVNISTRDADMAYTGDAQGKINAQVAARALIDKDKNLLALVYVRANQGGLGEAVMKWRTGCSKRNTEYIHDATQGSFDRLDCLRVWPSMSPAKWIEKNAAATHAELVKLGIKPSEKGYQFRHQVGNDNGSFVFTSGMISHAALAAIPEAAKGEKHEGKPGVAWGHLLASADRASLASLSGELKLPKINYQ